MQEATTWRELLGSIIQDPQERRRLANELGVNPVTLTRWVNSESSPRSQSIQRLLNALPQHRKALHDQLLDEFGGLISEPEDTLTEDSLSKIPSEFYIRVLTHSRNNPPGTPLLLTLRSHSTTSSRTTRPESCRYCCYGRSLYASYC